MKRYFTAVLFLMVCVVMMGAEECANDARQVAREETQAIAEQQAHLLVTQPVPAFDYSLQRDVLIQVYRMSNEAQSTYTVVDSITGQTIWSCPSIGFGIPADTSLTNPLTAHRFNGYGTVVEQAEPNGLYSSKNTDGTWIVCVGSSGELAPIYTEHKVTTFPYAVEWSEDMGWVPVNGNDSPSFTVDVRGQQ